MNKLHLVLREISYNRLNFAAGILSVLIASAAFICGLGALKAYDIETGRILARKKEQIDKDMAKMEDDYRKIMLKLGLNIFILPENQNLDNFYDEGFASKFIPEDYIDRLAASNFAAIQHLLPVVERKIAWQEKENRTIILVGIKGEIPFIKASSNKPMIDPVPKGKIVLGYELWNSLGLKTGDDLRLMGEPFKVGRLQPQRGTNDDITAWIDIGTAQRLLGLQGKLSGIMALQCFCEGSDMESINKKISEILPGTKVIFFQNEVVARAEARSHAARIAEASLKDEDQNRLRIRNGIESFASLIIPAIMIICLAVIVLLAAISATQRRTEIATLRALGCGYGRILCIFLARALMTGLAGACAGIITSMVILHFVFRLPMHEISGTAGLMIMAGILVCAPALTIIASWMPAARAVNSDPASILGKNN